jgi:predicted Na+-dependent transporter
MDRGVGQDSKLYSKEQVLIALVLNLTMIFLGYYLAKFLASGVAQRKCISLECGLQNGTLALFVGTQLFDNDGIHGPNSCVCINNVFYSNNFCSHS